MWRSVVIIVTNNFNKAVVLVRAIAFIFTKSNIIAIEITDIDFLKLFAPSRLCHYVVMSLCSLSVREIQLITSATISPTHTARLKSTQITDVV